jgi:hypothetical protein
LAFGWCGAAVVVVGYWLLNGSGKVGADVCKIYENYMGKTMAWGPFLVLAVFAVWCMQGVVYENVHFEF